jgi:hypothetical protein
MRPSDAWLAALADPRLAQGWSLADWQRVLRLTRRLRLLGRLAEALDAAGLTATLPAVVQAHLLSERRASRFRLLALNWTAEHVAQTLAGADYPCVLLKGGAYVAQGLPIAAGRLPSDLDILVPRASLANAQQRLKAHGWQEQALDAHDQRYYHEYSHEVPPMRHPRFAMELDLHHAILPPVARTTTDMALLLARVVPSGQPGWQVLCPVDQVLHSAAHLFLDSELRDRLRDLVDLDGLMRLFSQRRRDFWDDLGARAAELGLEQPLALACHFCALWLDTPVPPALQRRLAARALNPVRRAWLLPLLDAVLTPTEPDATDTRAQNRAATVLLARYHAQRMPLRLLLPHLWHKARKRRGADGD